MSNNTKPNSNHIKIQILIEKQYMFEIFGRLNLKKSGLSLWAFKIFRCKKALLFEFLCPDPIQI